MILVIYSDSHISSIPGVGLVIYCTNVIPSRCVMSFPPVFCLCVVCCNSRFASPMLYGRALSTSRVFYAPIHLLSPFLLAGVKSSTCAIMLNAALLLQPGWYRHLPPSRSDSLRICRVLSSCLSDLVSAIRKLDPTGSSGRWR